MIDENERNGKGLYRDFFKSVSQFIRFQALFREYNINVQQPNFSNFLRGNDTAVTEESLKKIKKACENLGATMNEKI